MPELTAADLAEGRRLMEALANPATGAVAEAQMAMWLLTHLPALVDAAEKLARVREYATELESSPAVGGSSSEQWEFDTERRIGRMLTTLLRKDSE